MPAAAVVIGEKSFAQEYLAKVVKRAEVMCEAVAELPEFAAAAYPSRKIALRILVDCVKPRFAYFARVTRPEISRPVAKKFDQVVAATARRINGFTETEAESSARQASLRPKDGGLGLLPTLRFVHVVAPSVRRSYVPTGPVYFRDLDRCLGHGQVRSFGRNLRMCSLSASGPRRYWTAFRNG